MKTPLLSVAAFALLALSAPGAIVINLGQSLTVVFDNLQEIFDGRIFLPSGRIYLRPTFPPSEITEMPLGLIYEDSVTDTPTPSELLGGNQYFTFAPTMLQDGDGVLVITARSWSVTVESLTVFAPIQDGLAGHVLTQTVTVPEPSTASVFAAAALCLLGLRRRFSLA